MPRSCLTLCALLVGCGGAHRDDAAERARARVVKVVVPGMPTTLDWNTSNPSSWLNYPALLAALRGLTVVDEHNRVGPGVAASWDLGSDGKGHPVYTFHLRPDVVWSDGTTPLRADDFVVGWRRSVLGWEGGDMSDILGASAIASHRSDLLADPVKRAAALAKFGVRAVDAHTLEVTLDQPRSYFLARIANSYIFFPAPSADLAGLDEEKAREYFDHPAGGKPMALGPYRVDAWDRAGERVRLVYNAHTSFPPPTVSGTMPASEIVLMTSVIGPQLYEKGEVDFVFDDSVVSLRAERPADRQREPLLSTFFLVMNTQRPPLDDVRVRQAIAHALDRDALVAGLLPTARATRRLLPPDLPGGAIPSKDAERWIFPGYDPAIAKQLLDGKTIRPLRLVIASRASFLPETAIAERIRRQLAKVGIPVEIDARVDWSDEAQRETSYGCVDEARGCTATDLYLRRLGADFAHPKTFFSFFEKDGNHASGWERVDGGKAIDRFEELLARGDAEQGGDAEYVAAERLLVGEQAVIAPLYHPDRYFRVRPGVEGTAIDPFNFISLSKLVVRVQP